MQALAGAASAIEGSIAICAHGRRDMPRPSTERFEPSCQQLRCEVLLGEGMREREIGRVMSARRSGWRTDRVEPVLGLRH